MFNRIRRLIGTPFIVVTGILFGLTIYLFYGGDDLHRFCDWLSDQARIERLEKLKMLEQKLIKLRIQDV